MRHSLIETLLGAVILAIAICFLAFGLHGANVHGMGGKNYILTANFSTVGPLRVGDAVKVSGVKVGIVEAITLNARYQAHVRLAIDIGQVLPVDTAAAILSEGLMGGVYLALLPGGEEDFLANGGHITSTQPPQNLEQLLGKFIFSVQKTDEKP